MKILCPIPQFDFDPTEVSVPWDILTQSGHEFVFATPTAKAGLADQKMVTGSGLFIFKKLLMASKTSLVSYFKCIDSTEFKNPISYVDMKMEDYDALFLPGGHAKGMREYLESSLVHTTVVEAFSTKKIVAAVCHGTLCAARSIDPKTNKSVLYGKKTTGLSFMQEFLAWALTCLWLGNYYRTYPKFMQYDLQSYLKNKNDYSSGPIPLFRDEPENYKNGHIVIDENYLSARWPGDIYHFSHKFLSLLEVGTD